MVPQSDPCSRSDAEASPVLADRVGAPWPRWWSAGPPGGEGSALHARRARWVELEACGLVQSRARAALRRETSHARVEALRVRVPLELLDHPLPVALCITVSVGDMGHHRRPARAKFVGIAPLGQPADHTR